MDRIPRQYKTAGSDNLLEILPESKFASGDNLSVCNSDKADEAVKLAEAEAGKPL